VEGAFGADIDYAQLVKKGAVERDGGGVELHALVNDRLGADDRCQLAEAGSARPLQERKFKLRHYPQPGTRQMPVIYMLRFSAKAIQKHLLLDGLY
jgi:hypothetical protein